MKLKTKIILSFGSVAFSMVLVFAEIIHYTFLESLRQSSIETLHLKSQQIILKTNHALELSFRPVLALLPPPLPASQPGPASPANLDAKLADIVSHNNLYTNALLLSTHHNQILAQTPDTPQAAFKAVIFEHLSQNQNRLVAPSLLTHQSGLFLIWPMVLNNKSFLDYILVTKLDATRFKQQILSYLEIDDSELFISQNDTHLLSSFSFPPDNSLNESDVHKILDLESTESPLTPIKNFFFFSSDQDFLGWRLNLIIPRNHLTENLIALKNRILVAILIMGWVSMWVILILAYKISSPIKHLTKITKDIIAFNYTTEFEFKHTNDEIGELSSNFETMRVKIKNLITKDPLTHTFNRRFLMHVFEMALLKTIRLEEDLALIILDIDNFKSVNDTYGHQCGDEVLKRLGQILIDATRNYDTAARYGGEEFVVLLPNTNLQLAHSIAERIRQKTAETVIEWEGTTLQCTLSLGIARFHPEHANTTAAIINQADKALYEAKESGKNQTVVYQILAETAAA